MIIHANCADYVDVFARFAECDVMITDPPYSATVHRNATSQSKTRGARHRDMGFDHLTPELRRVVAKAAASVRRWGVIYSDVEHSTWMRIACKAAGAQYVRTMPWVRWSMPQLTGDRPPQGFEHVMLFWGREPGRKSWNGPGNLTHLQHSCLRGEDKHKAEKPLDQALDLVSWFSEPGETILDLFAGSGTIPLACKLLGRECIAFEADDRWWARSVNRCELQLSERDRERVQRWLNTSCEPVSSQKTGPSVGRADRRASDRALVAAVMG